MNWSLVSKRRQPITSPTFLRLKTEAKPEGWYETRLVIEGNTTFEVLNQSESLSEAVTKHMQFAKRYGFTVHTESMPSKRIT